MFFYNVNQDIQKQEFDNRAKIFVGFFFFCVHVLYIYSLLL